MIQQKKHVFINLYLQYPIAYLEKKWKVSRRTITRYARKYDLPYKLKRFINEPNNTMSNNFQMELFD